MNPTILQLAADLAAGRTTSRNLTEAALARIEDPKGEGKRAFIKVYKTQALAAADASDALRKAGIVPSPLAGLPISIKNLCNVAGETTLAGSRALDDAPPAKQDAPVVARLRAAGAGIVGSTNISQLAFSGIAANPHYGTPCNPADHKGVTGVSSSARHARSAKGVKIEQIELPELNELASVNGKGGFAASEAYAWHQKLIARRGNLYDPFVHPRIMRGKEMSAADYIDLLQARVDLQKRTSAVTSNYDATIMPTCAIVAPTLEEVATPEGFTKKNLLLLRNTAVGNFLDRCAISLPCHAARELPVGFMLMGEAMGDKRLLGISRSVAPIVRG